MQSSVGPLIGAARRRLIQIVLERAGHHQLSALQFWMIFATRESPEISQVELSARMLADAASVSRALFRLSRRGLVQVATDPHDRRRSRVRLTPAGDRLAAELAPLARELRDALVKGLSPAEVGSLCDSLHRLIANLDELGQPGDSSKPIRSSGREDAASDAATCS